METAIAQLSRNPRFDPWAHSGAMHGDALPKPIFPPSLYAIYTCVKASAAFLSTNNSYPYCGSTCTNPIFPVLMLIAEGFSEVKYICCGKGDPPNQATTELKWTISFASLRLLLPLFPVVSFSPCFHRIIEKTWVGRALKNQLNPAPLPYAAIPPSRSGCVGPHPTFCSIPGYSCTAGICRCWFTASQHTCLAAFISKRNLFRLEITLCFPGNTLQCTSSFIWGA